MSRERTGIFLTNLLSAPVGARRELLGTTGPLGAAWEIPSPDDHTANLTNKRLQMPSANEQSKTLFCKRLKPQMHSSSCGVGAQGGSPSNPPRCFSSSLRRVRPRLTRSLRIYLSIC